LLLATRSEQKARARAERLARGEADARAAAQRRRLYLFGAIALVAVVIVAAVIAITSGSSSSSNSSTSASGSAAQVRNLLAGIPQSGRTLGRASAPVTVTLYEDLECPVCRDFTLGGARQLIAKDVRAGRVKLVFRSLQTATPDPTTFQVQQQAALAAGQQNRLWHFVELFYHQQGAEGTPYVTESYLDKLAREIPGFNHSKWVAARKPGSLASQVTSDESLAKAKGLDSTPTIVVQGPKASPQPVAGAASYSDIEQLVTQAGG
jgi:protein-disulfide isomerase